MILRWSILPLVLLVGGCALLSGPSTNAVQQASMAGFAAGAQYPKDAKVIRDQGSTALIDREAKTVRVINPTDQPLRDVRVWVNGAFVHRVDVIAAHSNVLLRGMDFFNAEGKSLADAGMDVSRVEIQRGNDLFLLPLSYQ